jgi:hypothetical protein
MLGKAVPRQLAEVDAGWVRCVVRRNIDISDWIRRLDQGHGIKTLLIGDGSDTSLGTDESQWRGLMEEFKARYGDIVKMWQWGNEPDHNGLASWKMDRPSVNRLLQLGREVFPQGEFTLVAPGLVSGNWLWLSDTADGNGEEVIDFSPVDALDLHPYAKFPGTQPLIDMFTDYRREFDRFGGQGKPIWCTEYDSRTPGMGADLLTRAERVAVMCWDSGMTTNEAEELGIIDGLDRMNNYRDAAGLMALASLDELNALALLQEELEPVA